MGSVDWANCPGANASNLPTLVSISNVSMWYQHGTKLAWFHKVTDVLCVVMQVPMSEECALLADGWKLGKCVEEGYDLDNGVTSQVKINVDSAKCPRAISTVVDATHSHVVCFSLNHKTQKLSFIECTAATFVCR